MATRKRTFTPEFRAEAVRLVQTSGRSRWEVAEKFDIGFLTLRNWIDGRREWEMDSPPSERQEDMAAVLRQAAARKRLTSITRWATLGALPQSFSMKSALGGLGRAL